jgi:hypothetical protein
MIAECDRHVAVSCVRAFTRVAIGLLMAVLFAPAVASAAPDECNEPTCVGGITGGVVLGATCSNTAYFVFGTTSSGRLVFCGSPRRYGPRYFRSPPLAGVRDENSSCTGSETFVAQAPDGLFLTCVTKDDTSRWLRGDV